VVSGPAALRQLPHAGFGLGFERMVMYLTGVSNIRDVLPHPRTVGSADF
jgi:asparaginyl-tRNA synthetase